MTLNASKSRIFPLPPTEDAGFEILTPKKCFKDFQDYQDCCTSKGR